MPYQLSPDQISDLEDVLSPPPRFATYLRATHGNRQKAMQLYCWNTEISAAFYVILQFCELSVRNGAVEAVEAEFGANWHLNRGFLYTLPQPKRGYKPRDDLAQCANRLPTAGKVVAELRFAFWQCLFVKGQDQRLWNPHFASVFPGNDKSLAIPQARRSLHQNVEKIRYFRNRIAHHAPIFRRNLAEDRDMITLLIQWRRPGTAA